MDSNDDFDKMNTKKGAFLNGEKLRRLLATPGGGKNSTVVYVSAKLYPELSRRLDNGRDLTKKMNPAKLEAYKALSCSASIPVSQPTGVLVVKDVLTTFTDNVYLVDDTRSEDRDIEPDVDFIENYEIKDMNASDGFGLMLPSRSETWAKELDEKGEYPSFTIRNSFCKGVLHPFDFLDFANKFSDGNYMVNDAWGDARDIRECDVILTTSMLKLWDSYESIDDYLKCCEQNGYTFSITKSTPEKPDNQRHLNYQFIQSLNLTDVDIDALIKQTVDDVFDIMGGDYRKALIYLKGKNIEKNNILKMNADYVQALMIDKNMMKDPFVKNHIHKMIKNEINEAKIGVLKVNGNFSLISGDPYTLCQSIFNKPLTGLLGKGEYYSQYWIDKGTEEVAAFRAPMTCMNNIRKYRFKVNDDTKYWYKYMNTVTILNSWDTTTHAMNGEDFDGDTNFTTDNKILISSIKYKEAILCVQKSTMSVAPLESHLIKANKNSFGDAIGTTTNRITSMYDVLAQYEEGSPEYDDLQKRIICGQNYQQNAIDKTKGVKYKAMPKRWYDRKANMPPILLDNKKKPVKDDKGSFIFLPETDEDRLKREYNLKLLADKRPYFFIWKESSEMKKYKQYIEQSERNCSIRFGIKIEALINKQEKTKAEESFLEWYYRMMPVSISDSVMNRICKKVEIAFKDIGNKPEYDNFNPSILKTDKKYSKARYNLIYELYKQHNKEMRNYMSNIRNENILDDEESAEDVRIMFVEKFREEADKICNNEEDLCNMVVDICYHSSLKSKQFAWDVAGEQIIRNLLSKNNYTFCYPTPDAEGDFEYSGEKYKMKTFTRKVDSY
jgi:hypothetical protein